MTNITGKELKLSGPDIGKLGRPIMESNGWTRFWCANHHKPLPKMLAGLSDNGYGKPGQFLFLEDKGYGDVLRPSQITFMKMLNALNIPGVRYVVAETKEDYDKYALIGGEK